jgi:hypothetical protein
VKGRDRKVVRISTTLAPDGEVGRALLERSTPEMSPSAVAVRDLGRYYALLEAARRRLRGRFSAQELEALAYALQGMALIEVPELLYLAPATVAESVEHEDLCAMAGIEDCQGFLERVRGLELAEVWALVDAVGRYLSLPNGERGEEGWRRLGLL